MSARRWTAWLLVIAGASLPACAAGLHGEVGLAIDTAGKIGVEARGGAFSGVLLRSTSDSDSALQLPMLSMEIFGRLRGGELRGGTELRFAVLHHDRHEGVGWTGSVGVRLGGGDGELLVGPSAAFAMYPFRMERDHVALDSGTSMWTAGESRPPSGHRYHALGLTLGAEYTEELPSLFVGPSYQLIGYD